MLKALPRYSPPKGISSQAFAVNRQAARLAWAIIVVKFDGTIPDGSLGRDHAEFVKLSCLEAMARQDSKCLVMDFSDCSYRWGNSIEVAFDAFRRLYHYEWFDLGMTTPVKVVTSEKSIGFETMLPPEMLFGDVSDAIASCDEDLKKWEAN